MGGSFRKYYHFVAPSCKLELARFSAWVRIQDGAECGNMLNFTMCDGQKFEKNLNQDSIDLVAAESLSFSLTNCNCGFSVSLASQTVRQ